MNSLGKSLSEKYYCVGERKFPFFNISSAKMRRHYFQIKEISPPSTEGSPHNQLKEISLPSTEGSPHNQLKEISPPSTEGSPHNQLKEINPPGIEHFNRKWHKSPNI
jgi:hypothetical protein